MAEPTQGWHLIALMLFFAGPCLGWKLPSISFLETFALKLNREGLNIYLPGDAVIDSRINRIIRHFSKLGMPVGVTNELNVDYTKPSFSRSFKAMYVTTAGNFENKEFNDTMSFVQDNFKLRGHAQKEIWLMGLEIPVGMNTEERLRNPFVDVKLDINDDVFVYLIDNYTREKENLSNLKEQKEMMVYEVYKNQEGGPPIFLEYGAWLEETGTLEHTDLDKYMRRRNLQGVNLVVTAKHSMPHIGITADDKGVAVLKEGIFVDLFLELQNALNFSYTTYASPDGQWGTLGADGAWTGVVGELQMKRADIALSGLMVTQARSRVITYSTKMDEVFNVIFIQNPAAGLHWTVYLDPLTDYSWVIIGTWVVAAAPILFIVARYGKMDGNIGEFTIPKVFVMVAGSFTNRGWSTTPTSWKAKIAFTCFLLGGVTIYWHWEAMLISYLATRVTPLPFRDLKGLYESDYSLFVYPGSAVWDTFRYGSQLRQDIFKAKLKPYEEEFVTYKDRPSQIARLMQDTKNAMFSEFYTLAVFDEYIDCKFIQIPGKYDPKDYAIGYQQNSVYAELLDYWINRMIENGVLDSLKTQYRKDAQECPSLSGEPVNVGNVISALFVIVGGFSTAVAFFAIELITAKVGVGTRLMNFYNQRVEEMGSDDLGYGKRWVKTGSVDKDGKRLRQRTRGQNYLS